MSNGRQMWSRAHSSSSQSHTTLRGRLCPHSYTLTYSSSPLALRRTSPSSPHRPNHHHHSNLTAPTCQQHTTLPPTSPLPPPPSAPPPPPPPTPLLHPLPKHPHAPWHRQAILAQARACPVTTPIAAAPPSKGLPPAPKPSARRHAAPALLPQLPSHGCIHPPWQTGAGPRPHQIWLCIQGGPHVHCKWEHPHVHP